MRYDNLQIPTAIRPDAKLGKLTTDMIGKFYAYQRNLDGFSVVEIKPLQLTATDSDYLGGNDLKATLVVPEEITDLKAILAPVFPNLTTVIIGNTEEVVSGLSASLDGLSCTIIVPNNLLSDYQAAYQGLTFDSWVYQTVFDIPASGESELTYEWVDTVIAGASGDISSVDKVVVDSSFTTFEVGVFDYIFLKFVNCQEVEYSRPRLPVEYQEVEYIESTGTQWIDTNQLASSTTNVKIIVDVSSYQNNKAIFGTSISGQATSAFRVRSSSNSFICDISKSSISVSRLGKLDISFNDQHHQLIVNGEIDGTFDDYASFSNQQNNIAIFTVGRPDLSSSWAITAKLYSCKIYDNGTLVRDFIPCYRISDGEVGLYDLVNNQFYTNQGTGTFAKGSDIQAPTITRPALSTATIYYDSDTSHTLTPEIVQATLTKVPEFASCEKVIVPVWFTEYQSGSISAIESSFSDMEVLTTCYEAGNIDLDMNGDIVAKIVSIGKTVDEALVYARSMPRPLTQAYANSNQMSNQGLGDPNNVVIIPPLGTATYTDGSNSWTDWFFGFDNLVAIYNNTYDTSPGTTLSSYNFVYLGNAVFIEATFTNTQRMTLNFAGCSSMKYLLLHNYSYGSFNISVSTQFTRQALIDLFNSLGTPDTTQTFHIGSTNLAKLTQADIDIATAKNWSVVA